MTPHDLALIEYFKATTRERERVVKEYEDYMSKRGWGEVYDMLYQPLSSSLALRQP